MPNSPPSRCTDPECSDLATNRGRCDQHQPEPWANRPSKTERYGISAGTWRALKRRTARRDNHCCYLCGIENTDGSHQLDHKIPVAEGGSPRNPENLGLACTDCHDTKSKAEAARANQRRRSTRARGGD